MTANALIIAAPASGHGKTLVTAGLARALQAQHKKVTVFKMGPDYLDPMFLRQAAGLEVRQLDYWMLANGEIAAELARASEASDFVLIEGVMGLFDGKQSVSVLAKEFNIPVLVVADASAMAQTFGALMHGLNSYDDQVTVAGAIANRVGSDGHGEMIRESLRPPTRYVGWIKRDESLVVPERHLGIQTDGKEVCLSTSAAMAECLTPMLPNLPWQPLMVKTQSVDHSIVDQKPLKGKRIAIAKDAAFCFLYPANVDFLTRAGAEVVFFSPLANEVVPECDTLYLPGGYPELYLPQLAQSHRAMASIREHIEAEKPCLAECGGMLYLQQSLASEERSCAMVGVFSGCAVMGQKLAGLGYQSLGDSALRGHTFHYASVNDCEGVGYSSKQNGSQGEPIYRYKKTLASFVHWYFASDPERIIHWLNGQFTGVGAA